MPKLLNALRQRFHDRHLIEIDGSNLLGRYGQSAEARALFYESQGAAQLSDGRRPGHWERVARLVARRPQPSRSSTAPLG